jgi:aldose 1-epimerase
MPHEIVTITEPNTGATAQVAPSLGFNCFSFRAAPAGEPVEVLWADPEFSSGHAKPTRTGIPILFPFPGRIRGGSYEFQGRRYELEIADERGNAIHGFVLRRPWRVIEHTGSRVVGQFQASVDDPSILEHWPADFRITVSYQLQGNTLASEIVVENPDQRPLPFGLGTHGYFRVPLGGHGAADDCRITVPVSTNWELVNLLPTGREAPSEAAARVAKGVAFGETQLDDVFGGLKFAGGLCQSTVYDPHNKRTLTVAFDEQFPICVVFNPPTREAICIEPYTTAPDAFNLQAAGVDPHLRVLAPGETFRGRVTMRLD